VEAGIILWIKWEKKWVQDTQMGTESFGSFCHRPDHAGTIRHSPAGARFLAPLVAAHVLSNMGLLQTATPHLSVQNVRLLGPQIFDIYLMLMHSLNQPVFPVLSGA
jgi:hypothetical protein